MVSLDGHLAWRVLLWPIIGGAAKAANVAKGACVSQHKLGIMNLFNGFMGVASNGIDPQE